MSEDSLKVKECAAKARKAPKTIRRWITHGFKKKYGEIVYLAAEKSGLDYRVNPETFRVFLWQTGQAPDPDKMKDQEKKSEVSK